MHLSLTYPHVGASREWILENLSREEDAFPAFSMDNLSLVCLPPSEDDDWGDDDDDDGGDDDVQILPSPVLVTYLELTHFLRNKLAGFKI